MSHQQRGRASLQATSALVCEQLKIRHWHVRDLRKIHTIFVRRAQKLKIIVGG